MGRHFFFRLAEEELLDLVGIFLDFPIFFLWHSHYYDTYIILDLRVDDTWAIELACILVLLIMIAHFLDDGARY